MMGHVRSAADAVEAWVQAWPVLRTASWEWSCRFGPQGWQTQRVVWELPRAAGITEGPRAWPHGLGWPAGFAASWAHDLVHAQHVLGAVEVRPQGTEWRAYLGFGAGHPHWPGLAMRGWKWHPHTARGEDPSRPPRVSDYWRLPALTAPLSAPSGAQNRPTVWHWLQASVGQIEAKYTVMTGQAPTEWWAVTESGSLRTSLCARFYERGVPVDALGPLLRPLLTGWGCPDPVRHRLWNVLGPRPLGWLAGGDDAHGQPFVTIYAAAALDELRHLMAIGSSDA